MTQRDIGTLRGMQANLASLATVNAISGISRMLNKEIRVSRVNTKRVPMPQAAALLGRPGETVVGVYLTYSRGASGHILLAFPERAAFEIIDLALGVEPGTTRELGEMEASVMGEMGNIAGTFFLNELSNSIGAIVNPSPPAVIRDMAGAIMDVVLCQTAATRDELDVLDLAFQSPERSIVGQLLVVPTDGALSASSSGGRT